MAVITPNCWTCKHRRTVPGDCHISCANPDPNMQGHPHGIRMGWFIYPLLFDPTWMARPCANHDPGPR
jgi:hypothetical protein